MSDIKIKVSTASGQVVGFLINPKVENLCDADYEISGIFVNEDGVRLDKVECNPEAVPYTLDFSPMPGLTFKQLRHGYVQRGRQPVVITAVNK
ncbi:MAG: hypothetical protein K2W82_00565 [Candidatus Obscuribacterales bacterium]|nr:hypothetical protein [Candidatus Obscuribacterales bacterium]